MRDKREVRAVRPLMDVMDLTGEDLSATEAMAGVLKNGELTIKALREEGRIPFDDNIFLVAHKVDRPTPVHRHDFIEIAYVLKGRIINRIDGKELYLPEGIACIMNRESEHMLDVDNPDSIICNVCIRHALLAQPSFARFLQGDNLIGRFARGETGSNYLVLADTGNTAIRMAMSALINAYADNDYHEAFDVEARTMLLLVALAQAKVFTEHGADKRVIDMLDYITEHSATVTVGSLAREFGYNENYLSQYIKKATGKRAGQFIVDAKLEHACDLLRDTSHSVEHIAHEVGYKSYSRFHQVFKGKFGMTPKEWREAH